MAAWNMCILKKFAWIGNQQKSSQAINYIIKEYFNLLFVQTILFSITSD